MQRTDLRLMRVSALTVDAWTVQHPSSSTDEAIRDLGVHLVSLYAQLALGLSYRSAKWIRHRASETIEFRHLPLPGAPARYSVMHPLVAEGPEVHQDSVREWARSVWQVWHPHHEQVMSWARRIVGHGRVAEPPREDLAGWYAGARNFVHPN